MSMKTKLAILLVVGLQALGLVCSAQNDKPASGGAEEAGQLIQIEDTELLDVVKSLARQAGINILFDPALTNVPLGPDGKPLAQPKVSIRLENVTPQQALEAVLNNYGLAMVMDPKTKIARVAKKDPTVQEPLLSKVYQLKYSSPTNIVPMVTAVISTRSKVVPDLRTSQMLVLATEKEMETVKDMIEKLDTPTRQVLIEARIMETSKNPRSLRGIDWAGTLEAQNFGYGNGLTAGSTTTSFPGATTSTTTATPGGSITTSSTTPSTSSTTLQTSIGGLIPGISANTKGGFAPGIGFLNADGVRGVLSFLNTDADTEVLSTPRTVMLDNQTAKLSVTKVIPVFKITPGSANTPAGSEIIYTNIGTILEVTPHIAGSNVSMRVIPEVSNIDSVDRQTVNGQVNTANIFAVRRIETQVVIPSGNTLVMGGLVSDTTLKGYSKVPFLGDMPGPLSYLFRKDTKTRAKATLLIFITPTVVVDDDFSVVPTDFLRNKPLDKPDIDENYLDSGKPKEWGKK
jgi:type IV pilus assembly protein PilQ